MNIHGSLGNIDGSQCKLSNITFEQERFIHVQVDCGKWYEKKLKELCPDTAHTVKPAVLPIFGWKDFNVGRLPSLFNYGHIYHWLVVSLPTLCDACEESGDDDDARRAVCYIRKCKSG